MTPPILLLIFNRPDLTEQVMTQIRKAEPPQLFVAADGPRTEVPEDPERCEQAREVATQVDWDCEVHTLFRDENLGCKEAVSSAITWFFEHVEAGVILEDDCVPHPTFFPYCSELLERYRDDNRIMTISGNNFQPLHKSYDHSYYFSAYMHCWGWATWRQAWNRYDGQIPRWESLRGTGWLNGWLGTDEEAAYWRGIFDQVTEGEIDSWAYPWTFACWREHALHVLPAVNLVSNVGFGRRSTHTKDPDSEAAHMPTKPLLTPLSHPEVIIRDYEADSCTSEHHFGIQDDSDFGGHWLRDQIPQSLKNSIRPLVSRLRE
jgi:hypothetical protein